MHRPKSSDGKVALGPIERLVRRIRPPQWPRHDSMTEAERAKERERRLLLSVSTSVAARLASVGAMLISVPIAHAHLTLEGFGVWMTLTSLLLIVQFADLGIGNGLVTLISDHQRPEERPWIAAAVSSAAGILVLVALVVALVTIVIAPIVDWPYALKISAQDVYGLQAAIVVFGVCVAATIPVTLGQKIQWGFQESFQANLWQILGSVLVILLMLLAGFFSLGLWAMVLAIAGGPVLALAINTFVQVVIRRPWLRPRLVLASREVARPLLVMGGSWAFYQALLFAATGLDSLFVTRIFGASSMASYGVMMRIMAGLAATILLTVPLWPAFAEALSRRDYSWARRTADRAILICSVVGACSGCMLLFGSQWFARKWVDPSIVPDGRLVIAFSAWVFVYNVFAGVTSLMTNALLMRKMLLITTIGSLLALFLKIPLAHFMGVAGISWASVIGIGGACIAGSVVVRSTLRAKSASNSHPDPAK